MGGVTVFRLPLSILYCKVMVRQATLIDGIFPKFYFKIFFLNLQVNVIRTVLFGVHLQINLGMTCFIEILVANGCAVIGFSVTKINHNINSCSGPRHMLKLIILNNYRSLNKKCVRVNNKLNFGQNNLIYSNLIRRSYYNQNMTDIYTMDGKMNNFTTLITSNSILNKDQGLLLKEIHVLESNLKPKLIKEINKRNWPMLKFAVEIKQLVNLKQKFLFFLARINGINSNLVQKFSNEWITSLELRVLAINLIYRSNGSKTSGIDNIVLKRENLLYFLDLLKYKQLLKYESLPIKRIYLNKPDSIDKRPIGIPTIFDRIVQKLFCLIIEPIVCTKSDSYSFGFQAGRSSHQAIGLLAKNLSRKITTKKKRFVHKKFILKLDISKFFDSVNHDWLINKLMFYTAVILH